MTCGKPRDTSQPAFESTRRSALGVLGGAAAALLAGGILPRNVAAQTTAMTVGYQGHIGGVVVHVGIKEGLYSQRGLTVEPQILNSGRVARDAVISNQVDCAAMGVGPFLSGAAVGEFAAIALVQKFGDASGLVVRKGITEVEQLRGQAIGGAVGSATTNCFVNKILPEFGLKPGDYQNINMDLPDMMAALASGSIAGYTNIDPYLVLAETAGIGTVLIRAGKWDPLPNVLCVNRQGLEASPEKYVQFVRNHLDVVTFWNGNKKRCVDHFFDMFRERGYSTMTRELTEQLVAYVDPNPNFDQLTEYFDSEAKVLKDAGRLPSIPDWSKALRTDILKQAQA